MTDIVMDGSKQIAKSLRDQAKTHRAYADRLDKAADLINPPAMILKPVRKKPTRKPQASKNKPAQATVYEVYRTITENPGITVPGIAALVGKSNSTVQNCIKDLRRGDKVRAVSHENDAWTYEPLS